MAIETHQNTTTSAETIYTSTNDTAITHLAICNTSASAVTIDLNVVPNGGTVADTNLMLSSLSIAANDTYVLYSGGEKMLLGNGDFISITSSAGNVLTSIISYTSI